MYTNGWDTYTLLEREREQLFNIISDFVVCDLWSFQPSPLPYSIIYPIVTTEPKTRWKWNLLSFRNIPQSRRQPFNNVPDALNSMKPRQRGWKTTIQSDPLIRAPPHVLLLQPNTAEIFLSEKENLPIFVCSPPPSPAITLAYHVFANVANT